MDECGAYQFSSASEIVEAFDNELTKIRVRIGKRSAVFAVYNADMEHAQGDCAMARKSGRLFVRPRRSAPTGCAAPRARYRSTPATWSADCDVRTTVGWPTRPGRWRPGSGAEPPAQPARR